MFARDSGIDSGLDIYTQTLLPSPPRTAGHILCEFRVSNNSPKQYITHPIKVSMIISQLGKSGENLALMQAGLLHDTVEDTDTTFEEIEREFGKTVRNLVAEHTGTLRVYSGVLLDVWSSIVISLQEGTVL
jgi:hypothetical protein